MLKLSIVDGTGWEASNTQRQLSWQPLCSLTWSVVLVVAVLGRQLQVLRETRV